MLYSFGYELLKFQEPELLFHFTLTFWYLHLSSKSFPWNYEALVNFKDTFSVLTEKGCYPHCGTEAFWLNKLGLFIYFLKDSKIGEKIKTWWAQQFHHSLCLHISDNVYTCQCMFCRCWHLQQTQLQVQVQLSDKVPVLHFKNLWSNTWLL